MDGYLLFEQIQLQDIKAGDPQMQVLKPLRYAVTRYSASLSEMHS